MKPRGSPVLLLACLLMTGGLGLAGEAGALEGYITGTSGLVIAGAEVAISSPSLALRRSIASGPTGLFAFKDLPAGADYTIQVHHGRDNLVQARVQVAAGRTTVESFVVDLASSKTLAPDCSDDGPSLTACHPEMWLHSLPLLGRSYQGLLNQATGSTNPGGDGEVGNLGGSPRAYRILVDGVAVPDALGGPMISRLAWNDVETHLFLPTAANASQGRGAGGFAHLFTRAGNNDFSGSLGVSLRSSRLDGNGTTGQPETHFRSFRPSLYLAGPLKKDRLWYVLGGTVFRDEIPVNTLSHRALLRESDGHQYLAKLSWRTSGATRFTTQFRSEQHDLTGLGVNTQAQEEAGYGLEQGGSFYSIQMDTPVSSRMHLQSLLAYTDATLDIIPTSPQDPTDSSLGVSRAYVLDTDSGAVSGSYFLESREQRRRWTWGEDLSVVATGDGWSHDLSMGISIEREELDADQVLGTVREVRSLAPPGEPVLVQANEVIGIPQYNGGLNRLSGRATGTGIYVTDTWKPDSSVAVTAGLRVDREELRAEGFAPLDPEAEFDRVQRFFAECSMAQPGTQDQAALAILGREMPEILAAFLASGAGFSPFNGCLQAKPFFLTFPKRTITSECRLASNPRACSRIIDNLEPVLNAKGNRPPEAIKLNDVNLAPRLSVSWDPWNTGKTKIFASWGRYFDRTDLGVAVAEQGGDRRGRSFLIDDQLAPRSITQSSDPSVYVVRRDFRAEFKDEWTVGFEREMTPASRLRLTYLSSRFRDLLRSADVNHFTRDVGPEFVLPFIAGGKVVGFLPVGGPAVCNFDPNVNGLVPSRQAGIPRGVVVVGDVLAVPNGNPDDCFGLFPDTAFADGQPDQFRRNPLFNDVFLISNDAEAEFEALTLEFLRRLSDSWQMSLSWTHSRHVASAGAFLDGYLLESVAPPDAAGFTPLDVRNAVTAQAHAILPWRAVQLGTLIRYVSGYAFGISERTAAPFDVSGQTSVAFPSSRRNEGRNESYLLVDVSVEMPFPVHASILVARLMVQNLLAEDFLTVDELQKGGLVGTRQFGRRYEAGLTLNF